MRRLCVAFVLCVLVTPAPAQIRPVTGEVADIITTQADAVGLDVGLMRVVAAIESSGDCGARTGSYKGLFQLSDAEFRRRGGFDIWNCRDNARAAAAMFVEAASNFRVAYGREATPTELYLVHQQGPEGLRAHLAEPERLAWQSMCTTAEGRQRGKDWCRLAIWGNVPSDVRRQFGDVDHITSAQFVEVWRAKVEGPAPTQVAEAAPEPSEFVCYQLKVNP